jgi:hypothetical protein
MELRAKRLLLFSLLEIVALCVLASSKFSIESTIVLLMFSFLFSSLAFQLEGSIYRKLTLLALGNVVGLFWNIVFYHFSSAGFSILGEVFHPIYTITYPLLNLLWVVPFWSVSLSVLTKSSDAQAKVEVEL